MNHAFITAFGLVALAAVGQAQAADPYSLSIYNNYRISTADGDQTFHTGRDWKDVSSTPTTASFSDPTTDREFWNVDLSASAAALKDSVSTSAAADWRAPADPDMRASGVWSLVSASSSERSSALTRGRIRFSLDYSLSASGEGASAVFGFEGSTSFVDTTTYGPQKPIIRFFQTSFSKKIDGENGPAELSGTWNSDWLYFDSQADLDEAYGYRWFESINFTPYAQSEFTPFDENNQINDAQNGSWRSSVTASFRHEVEEWDGAIPSPVPEPGTYALTATGLAALALARRRRALRR